PGPAMRLLRGPLEQAVGGGQIGDNLGGRALAREHGGALPGVHAEGVVVTAVAGGCDLDLGRPVGLEVLLVAGPAVEEPVAQGAAAVLRWPPLPLRDVEHPPVGGA